MPLFYAIARAACRFVRFNCIRTVTLHGERFNRPGGFVLAVTHLSHLEPIILAAEVHRKIDFMARIEFYGPRLARLLLHALDAFPVNRQKPGVRSIRTAVERARQGRIVGIFPEGGVARGGDSVMLGGPIKRGACVVARRAAVPILPVAILGTEDLSRVGPWLPFRRIKIHVIFGNVIPPRLEGPRRVARFAMAEELSAEFGRMYRELSETCGCSIEGAPTPPESLTPPDSHPNDTSREAATA